MRDVLTAMIQAHEIQGVLALENSFNRVGLDHVILVKVASTAVATKMLGGTTAADRRCPVARLDRRPEPAHLSPCPERGAAQILGRRRCDQPGGAARPDDAPRRTGVAQRPDRAEVGLPRRALQGQSAQALAAVRLLRHGERAVQDRVSRRVPRPDRGRVRDEAASTGEGSARPDRAHRADDAGVGDPHHQQDGPAAQSGRPRSLPAIHRRRAADLRQLDGRSLRGPDRRRSAHRRAARARWKWSRTRATRANIWSRTNARSPTRCRFSSRTARATEKVEVGVSAGPSPPPGRGDPAA